MNEAQVIVDDKVPVVRIIREFDAPVAKVFRAHVEPELFAKWNWPDATRYGRPVHCRTACVPQRDVRADAGRVPLVPDVITTS